jgi:hypothetical protein
MSVLPEQLIEQICNNRKSRVFKQFSTSDFHLKLIYKCECGYIFNTFNKNQIIRHFNTKKHSKDKDKNQMFDYFAETLDYILNNFSTIPHSITLESIKINNDENFSHHDFKFIFL